MSLDGCGVIFTCKMLDKNQATETLKYGIAICQGRCFKTKPLTRLALLLNLLEKLRDAGWWWQSRILNFWINRFIRDNKSDLQAAKQPDSSKSAAVLSSKKSYYQRLWKEARRLGITTDGVVL